MSLYFDTDEPADLQNNPRYLEIFGRVLGCDQIWKHAEETATREDGEEKLHGSGDSKIQVVHLGMVFGVCHYRSNALAILVSDYKELAPEN